LSGLGINKVNNVVDALNQHDLVHAPQGIGHRVRQTDHVMLARGNDVHAAQKQFETKRRHVQLSHLMSTGSRFAKQNDEQDLESISDSEERVQSNLGYQSNLRYEINQANKRDQLHLLGTFLFFPLQHNLNQYNLI
jgi:hypothetical protein